MTNIEMRKEWTRLHKGKNIMTPYYLEDWGNNSDTFAMIETGRGFDGEPIFGVAIIVADANGVFTRDCDRNELFYDLKDAQAYILGLNKSNPLHLHSYAVGHNPGL